MTEKQEEFEGGEIPNAHKLRNRLHHQFSEALGADPVCNGRVTSATVNWLADEAMRACTAVYRRSRGGVARASLPILTLDQAGETDFGREEG